MGPGMIATMTPKNKLITANALMLLGIIPLLISIYWMISSFATTDYSKDSEVADVVMVVGKAFFAYVFAFFVSGAGALWSLQVEKRTAGISVGASKSIRILVCVVLVVPLVLQAL